MSSGVLGAVAGVVFTRQLSQGWLRFGWPANVRSGTVFPIHDEVPRSSEHVGSLERGTSRGLSRLVSVVLHRFRLAGLLEIRLLHIGLISGRQLPWNRRNDDTRREEQARLEARR